MPGLTDLLSTEVVPWLRDTVSIGVTAGVAYKALNFIQSTWQQQPLVSYHVETSRSADWTQWDGEVTITVFNRSPSLLEIPHVEVVKGSEIKIGDHLNPTDTYQYWNARLAPYVPGADTFPSAALRLQLSWPEGGAEGKIKLAMRAMHQFILPTRPYVTIKLPKKAKPA